MTIKLLAVVDSPAVSTGLGRVAQGILERLYKTGQYDISCLATNQPIGDPHIYEGIFKIYPARAKGDIYGINRLEEIINKVKPDIILINNDLWIVSKYFQLMPPNQKVIIYIPVDAGPYKKEWGDIINKVKYSKAIAYTKFGERVINDIGINNTSVIGHGVDTDDFYPISDARKFLEGLPEDKFIVGMTARNQPRKRIDLFLKAAKLWIERKPKSDRDNIIFYYHGVVNDVLGWDLIDLAHRLNISKYFYVSDQTNISPAKGVPVDILNKLYNVFDLHVLTSLGEGWGLPTYEAAACGTPSVVPNNSANAELWKGIFPLINISHYDTLWGQINTEGAVIDIEHLVEILDDLYMNRYKIKDLSEKGYNYVHQEQFTWEWVANQFDKEIKLALENDIVTERYET